MSSTLLILHLVIAIAVILFCIIVLKLNPSIGMVLACLYLGTACGLSLIDTVDTITSGFGNMMTSIGLPIGFGIILGQLLSDSGGASVIADKIIKIFRKTRQCMHWRLQALSFPSRYSLM